MNMGMKIIMVSMGLNAIDAAGIPFDYPETLREVCFYGPIGALGKELKQGAVSTEVGPE